LWLPSPALTPSTNSKTSSHSLIRYNGLRFLVLPPAQNYVRQTHILDLALQ